MKFEVSIVISEHSLKTLNKITSIDPLGKIYRNISTVIGSGCTIWLDKCRKNREKIEI